jgi:hypothetical protein
MKKIKIGSNTTQFLNQAWARNGESIIYGEPLILGLLLHSIGKSKDRSPEEVKIIQALMGDPNYEED